MPGKRGDRGRRCALARHVAHDRHPPAGDREDVVEVAADARRLARGAEARGDRHTGDLGQPRRQQRVLERARDQHALAVHARVLDRHAGAPPELLGELEIHLVEPPAGVAGRAQRDRADDPLAGDERDDQRRQRADAPQRGELGEVARGRAQQRVVDARVELRPPGRHHVGRAHGQLALARVPADHEPVADAPALLDVGGGHALQPAALVGQVDRAPVGQLGDRRPGDLLQRDLGVQRRRKQLGGLGEEALLELGAARLGDVLDDVDGQAGPAVGAEDRGGLDEPPVHLAGGALGDAQQQRLGRPLPGERPAARQPLGVDRLAALVADVEALPRARGPAREERVLVRGAEQLGGRAVGVDDLAVGPLDGDRLGERADHGAQLGLGLAQRAEQPRVVDGDARAARELTREVDVALAVGGRAAQADPAERADRLAARRERDDDRRPVAGLAHEAQVGIVGRPASEVVGAELGDELRLAGAQRDRGGVVDLGRELAAQLAQPARQLRVAGGDRGHAQQVALAQVDHAHVGELGDGDAGEGVELADRIAPVEQLAGLGEKGGAAARRDLAAAGAARDCRCERQGESRRGSTTAVSCPCPHQLRSSRPLADRNGPRETTGQNSTKWPTPSRSSSGLLAAVAIIAWAARATGRRSSSTASATAASTTSSR